MRRPARFNEDAESDGEESGYEEREAAWAASKESELDQDLKSWFEAEVGCGMAVRMITSRGESDISGLSRRYLQPGNTMMLYWDYLSQGEAQGMPTESLAR